MASFIDDYQTNQIPKWKEKYIDYGKAYDMIQRIANNLNSSVFQQTNIRQLGSFLFNDDSIDKKDHTITVEPDNPTQMERHLSLSSAKVDMDSFIKSTPHGSLFTDLTSFLDEEIKKLYLFHIAQEKALFNKLNNHLHKKDNYAQYNRLQLVSEIKRLHGLLNETQEFCFFIHWNMECLKVINRDCDQTFTKSLDKGSVIQIYFRTKIECLNSDLNYILQFKLIDEISAIVSFLRDEILIHFDQIKKNTHKENSKDLPISPNSSTLSGIDQRLVQRFEDNIQNDDDEEEMNDKIKALMKEHDKSIDVLLNLIDNDNHYRVKYKNFQISIRYGFKTGNKNNFLTGIKLEDNNDVMHINCLIDEELIIKKFLSKHSIKEYSKYNHNKLSVSNRRNFYLLFCYIFFYYFNYGFMSIHSSFDTNDTTKHRLLFLQIGHFVSLLLFNCLLKQCKIIKLLLLLSYIFLFLGLLINILYQYDVNIIISYKKYMNPLSAFLIGLGCSQAITSKYFITYSSPPLLRETLKKHHLFKYIGLTFGYSLAVAGLMVKIVMQSCVIGSYGIISFAFLFTMYFFTNPSYKLFSTTISDTYSLKSEVSISKRKKITVSENQKVEEANQVLFEENKTANFYEGNFIPKVIKNIINQQRHTWKTKCLFPLIFFVLLCIHFNPDFFFYYFSHFNDNSYISHSLLYSSSCALSAILFLLFILLFKRFKSNRLILVLLFIIQLILITLFWQFDTMKWIHIMVLMILVINLLIENECNKILVKFISQDYNCLGVSGSLLLSFSIILGKIAVFVFFQCLHYSDMMEKKYCFYLLEVTFTLPFLAILLLYRSIKHKAYHRLIKKNYY